MLIRDSLVLQITSLMKLFLSLTEMINVELQIKFLKNLQDCHLMQERVLT